VKIYAAVVIKCFKLILSLWQTTKKKKDCHSVTMEPPVQWGLGVYSMGLKWLGCESDHLPSSSAEVKNVWSCNTPLNMCRMSSVGSTSGSRKLTGKLHL